MNARKRTSSTATFPRCGELRDRAGMDIEDLMQLVGPKPAKASYQRIERGLAVRASSAFKIANALNGAHKQQGLAGFDVDEEVQYV